MNWRATWRLALFAPALLATTFAACAGEPGPRAASAFLSPELKAEQEDEAANRGMLWVEQGARLWQEPPAEGAKRCADCHGDADRMRGVAARYPAIDAATRRLVNLEARVNLCRERHQMATPLAYESEALLALTALLAHRSRGLALNVKIDGPAKADFEAGRSLFDERQGQLDLACRQCHVDNVGRKLRGDTISSGLGTGYPAYRLEWQGLGSLHRRLQACQAGVRAVSLVPGSREHLSLELYLAWRGRTAPIEAPGIRR